MLDQLVDLQRHGKQYLHEDGLLAEDELFYAEQNAKTVKDAAAYYRSMFSGRALSWNLRDKPMVDTLEALSGHLSRQHGEQARIVVWAHNFHWAMPARPSPQRADSSTSANWSGNGVRVTVAALV